MDNKPASGAPPTQSIDYRTSEDFIVRYANNTYFEPSLYDLRLIFGQLDQKLGTNVVTQHTSITLPWPQVKVALYFLANQLAAYEAGHGRVVIEHGIIPPVSEQAPKDVSGVPQEMVEKVWAILRKAYEKFMKENPEVAPLTK
jgi:hypothetical protein